jgi:hypothetical protein
MDALDTGGAPGAAGFSGSNKCSSPSRSSESCTKADAGAVPARFETTGPAAASAFNTANNESGSLPVSSLSGSINSAFESSGLALRDVGAVREAEDAGVAPTDTRPSIGASTGKSVRGSKTGRDAASIVSSLVASSNAIGTHVHGHGQYILP